MAIYKYGWEVEPGTTRIKFNEWSERVLNPGSRDLKASALLDEIKIPRAFLGQMKAVRETSLHVFCDSSQDAYGACAYLKRKFKDTTVECRLVAGKGRVAPLKTQSICRLELMGALLEARLAEILATELTMKIEKITFWSDSTTVLHWIGHTSSNYKAFVGNRVSEIHTIMSELESTLGVGTVYWRYVPTECNPADDITRGLCPNQLNMSHRYYRGPEFLYMPVTVCPESKIEIPQKEVEESERKARWVEVLHECEVLLGWKRYSSLAKMRKVVVYVQRFLNNTRTKREERLTGPLTVPELRSAQNYLVKRAQAESFGEEVQLSEKGREIHKRSRIKSLDPRLEDGNLVVGGRLQKAHAIPYRARHPKIIDSHHELAQLIVKFIVLITTRRQSTC